MKTSQQMDTMTGQSDMQDNMGGGDDSYGGGDGNVTLDKSVPEIADAFVGCKPGDMYKVVSDDENELVMQKMPSDGEEGGEDDSGSDDMGGDDTDSMPKSDNPAIVAIMARKAKR